MKAPGIQRTWTTHCIVWGFVATLGAGLWAADPAASKDRTPPLPPTPRAPTEFFRELLGATPSRRIEMLADKGPEARELILRRVQDYEALPSAGREEADFQLRLAEFRYYLLPLLTIEPTARASRLEKIPVETRPIVVDRLKAWDALTPGARQVVLESDQSLRYFARQQTADPARLKTVLSALPAARQGEVEAQFARWKSLSDAERADRTMAFRSIFDLETVRRQKVLGRVAGPDRATIEQALSQYSRMTAAEREGLIAGLEKFYALNPAERSEFLKNAARWQAMSPEERTAWRRLVLNQPAPPPLPPTTGRPPSSVLVVTNRN